MILSYDEFDKDSDYLPQLSENSQIYYDYNGNHSEDDDVADNYRLSRRLVNASY